MFLSFLAPIQAITAVKFTPDVPIEDYFHFQVSTMQSSSKPSSDSKSRIFSSFFHIFNFLFLLSLLFSSTVLQTYPARSIYLVGIAILVAGLG